MAAVGRPSRFARSPVWSIEVDRHDHSPLGGGEHAMQLGSAPAVVSASSEHQRSTNSGDRPSQDEAEAAVRLLIRWAGDDACREGLLDTPARVARAYRELFAGYEADPRRYLERTFEEVGGYVMAEGQGIR